MRKSNWLLFFSVIFIIYLSVIIPGCSTTDQDNGFQRYELNVVMGEGVTGQPTTGTYPYEPGDTIDYSYSLLPNYTNLVVTLDGETVEPTGTVVISGVHTLKATATTIYDIIGDWAMEEEYDDESSFSVTLTFSGTVRSGTVTDSDGGSGTYTVDSNNVINFNLIFPEVTYEYLGRFDDANSISGTSERIIGNNTYFGTWSATRIIPTVSQSGTGRRKSRGH